MQGAVVPNASISAKNQDTGCGTHCSLGHVRGSPSPGSGSSYDVTISASGFQQQVRNGVTIVAFGLIFRLSVQIPRQTVTVTAEAPDRYHYLDFIGW